MAYPFSRLAVSIQAASGDGLYYGRFSHGNAPPRGAIITGAALTGITAGAGLQTQIKLGGAATDLSSGNAALTTGSGGGGGITFDRFIAPNGDDSNNGLTPATAWSITALNTKSYAGLKIGIIGDVAGTQTPIQFGTVSGVQTTLFSIYQARNPAANSDPCLHINGGSSSGTPTYIASCNSAGAYTPRWAIIDFSQPGTGNKPTVEAAGMGQSFSDGIAIPANWGNTTIDALTIRNFTYAAIVFFCVTNTQQQGITIKNCEISGGNNVSSGNNPGAIWLRWTDSASITNNKIHDCVTTAGGEFPGGLAGVITFDVTNLQANHNTIYKCGAGVYMKDNWQWGTIAYNYLDAGDFGSFNGSTINGAVERACPGAGTTLTIHHNVCASGLQFFGASNNHFVEGTVDAYNNTIFMSANVPNGKRNFLLSQCTSATVGAIKFYNNLCYAPTGTINDLSVNCWNDFGITPATGGMIDFNAYGLSGHYFFGSDQAPPGLAADTTFAAWQGAGHDTHSINLTSTPFSGTPTAVTPTSFAISSSSPAFTGSQTGGIQGACDASGNASDGSGIIGCNF